MTYKWVSVILLALGAGGTIVLLTTQCRGNLPTSEPEPTAISELQLTVIPCCLYADLPPVCNIIPGQFTSGDVERAVGFRGRISPLYDELRVPAGTDTDRRWLYYSDYDNCLSVYFRGDIVSVVRYRVRYGVNLRKAVTTYGQPEKVQWIWLDDVEAYCAVSFLWPTKGVVMEASLPQCVEHWEEYQLRGILPIRSIFYFQPASLEEVVSTYYPRALLVDWSGMEE